jgi:hypothetical protein
MNEREWLASADPAAMLEAVGGRARERKLRLFAVACCRRLSHHSRNRSQRDLLEVVEGYADGRVEAVGLRKALNLAAGHGVRISFAVWFTAHPWNFRPTEAAREAGNEVGKVTKRSAHSKTWETARDAECAAQAALLRDVLGNPFRTPPAIDPAWLAWHEGLIASMARRMYEARDFADLPVLADALEEAGCADERLLGHCRSPGPHVRGCWPVDLLLGRS